MKRFDTEVAVGLFVVTGVACLVYLAVSLGGVDLDTGDTYVLKARFVSVSGLKVGSQVEVAGVRVGRVSRIALDPRAYEAEVDITLPDEVRIQEDAIASVRTQGIIGDKFLKISPGGSSILLQPGEEIFDTEPSISLEELISKYIFEGK